MCPSQGEETLCPGDRFSNGHPREFLFLPGTRLLSNYRYRICIGSCRHSGAVLMKSGLPGTPWTQSRWLPVPFPMPTR